MSSIESEYAAAEAAKPRPQGGSHPPKGARAGDGPANVWLKRLLFWGAAATVVALDQGTKALVRAGLERGESWPDTDWPVRIRHVTNTGAAFGILQDQTAFLVVMTVIGLAAIYLYYRNPPFEHGIVPAAIGLMLGGAVGNLIDRLARDGRVTDFIDFRFWPAFNVADSSINVGIAALVIGYLFFWAGPSAAQEPVHEEPPAEG